MSPPPEEMISWVLEGLALSAAEGVSISNLFDGVDAHLSSTLQPSLDDGAKDRLWKSLVTREDVVFLDEAKGAILKTLNYQYVLALEFGQRKVKIRNSNSTPALHRNFIQQPVQPSQPVISPKQNVPSLKTPPVSSLDENTPPATTRASHGPPAGTPDLVAGSPQLTPSSAPKRRGRKKGVTNPTPVVRKTSRTWFLKTAHATQEEADRQADVLEYEAGIARVYIDPPGSTRPEPREEQQQQQQQSEQREQSEEPRKKTAQPPNQMIAVFKSLNLTDPQWLRNRMGTWRPTYNARKVELEASNSASRTVKSKANRATETSLSIAEQTPNQVEAYAQASQPAETPSVTKSTSKKRKTLQDSDANPIYGPNMDANQQGTGQILSQSQAGSLPLLGQQSNVNYPQTALSQHHQPAQNPPQHHNFLYQQSGPMPPSYGLQNETYDESFNLQPSALAHFSPQVASQFITQQETPSQPETQQQSSHQNGNPTALTKPVKRRVRQFDIDAAKAAWSKKMCDELRGECLKFELSVRGTKKALVARLSEAFFELAENESAAFVRQPSPQPDVQQPALQHMSLQQPVLQSPTLGPRPGILFRLMQPPPKAYQSPYAQPGGTVDKSDGEEARSDVEDKKNHLIEPATKTVELSKKVKKGRKSKQATDSHPEPQSKSPHQQATILPPLPVSPKPLVPHPSRMKTRLAKSAKKDRERAGKEQDLAQSTEAVPQAVNHSEYNETTDLMSLAKDAALVKGPTTRRRAQAINSQLVAEIPQVTMLVVEAIASPQQTAESAKKPRGPRRLQAAKSSRQTAEGRKMAAERAKITDSPQQTAGDPHAATAEVETGNSSQATEDRHVTMVEAQSIESPAPPPDPPLVCVIETQSIASPRETNGRPSADTQQFFVEPSPEASTTSNEASPNVQSSEHGFAQNTNPPENDVSQPTQHPPLPLLVQMPLSRETLDHDQGYMYSRPGSGEQSNFDVQSHSPPTKNLQQSSNPYMESAFGEQSSFGTQPPIPYGYQRQENAYVQQQHHTATAWNPLPQQSQQGTDYQNSPQGPRLGSSSSSPTPRLRTPTLTQTSSEPQKQRKGSLPSSSATSGTSQPTISPAPGYSVGPDVDSQLAAQLPYKSARMAEIEAMEESLVQFSTEADAVELPDITARLFVSYNDMVGNLILSKDKTELTFRPVGLEPYVLPILYIQVPQIKENPNVSIPRSRPMELRIKYGNEEVDAVLSRFYFGQTEVAYQAANEMRAALVKARIICRASAGQTDTYELFREDSVANIEVVKPFQCEICKKRFKNREGIKYHQSKSNTTCNPNFDPSTKPKKPERAPKLKKDPKMPAVKKGLPKRSAKKAKKADFDDDDEAVDQDGDLLQSVEHQDASDSNSSSDDSILAWAEKVAFVNPGEAFRSAALTPKKVVPQKQSPRLFEEKVLSGLFDTVMNSAPADETIDSAVKGVLEDLVEEVITFTTLEKWLSGIADGLPAEDLQYSINHQRSKDIILALVTGNSGIFPGEKALWVAFVAVWLREHPQSGVLPISKLCEGGLEDLVQSKALVITSLPARRNDSMAPSRTIVMLPTVDPDSPVVQKLRELIEMAYPRQYIPSKFAPSTEVLEKLQVLIDGKSSLWKPMDSSKLAAISPRDSDYELAAEDDESVLFEDIIEDSEEFEDDSDEEYYEKGSRRTKHDKSVASKKQGQRMKNYWAASKAVGSKVLTKTENYTSRNIDSRIDSSSSSRSPDDEHLNRRTTSGSLPRKTIGDRPKARLSAWKGGFIPPEEKERRKILQANRMLNFATAPLPNAETGAWDQTPLHLKPAATPRKRVLRYQLPEPITYLQSENGAWDCRAYGHGAPPIHARPARRADGNPNLEAYLKKISQSHRPILWPGENATRVFLPAAPSKILLRTGKIPGEGRKISKSEISMASEAEYETTPQKPKKEYRKRKMTAISLDDAETEGGQSTQPASKRRRTNVSFQARSRFSKPLQDTIDPHSRRNESFQSKINLRVSRQAVKCEKAFGSIQQLYSFQPREFSDFERLPNPGLVSLPINFWLQSSDVFAKESSARSSPPPKLGNPASHYPTLGLKGFENVAAWEQGPMREKFTSGAKIVGLAWINHTADATEYSFQTEIVDLKWNEKAAFGVETLPYEDLVNSQDVELVEAVQEEPEAVQPPKKRQHKISIEKETQKKKIKTLRRRRLTAWPSDFDGVVDNIDDVRNELQVELASRLVPYTRNLQGTMSKQDEIRLLVAVIAVMTLTGGVDKSIDWVLVTNLFPEYAAHYLKRVWLQILKNRKPFIDTLTPEFQDAFLAAYEAGEVPKIDYEHLIDYDWAKVVDWALNKIYSKGHNNDVHLPNSRKELKKFYDIEVKENGVDKAREAFFNPSSAIYKRMEISASIPRTLPTQAQPSPKCAEDIEIDEFTLARSWIRALVFTPHEDYDIDIAGEKVVDLGNDLVNEVKQSLVDDKIIKHQNNGRAAPGRAFEPTEIFFSALRAHITEEQFAQAVTFKKFLDNEFANGKECVRSDYMANDGTIMCVTNLQAYGRIELKAVNPPMNKFGLTDGGYETKTIPKEKFRFEMDIYPASTYLFDEEIPELQEYVEPPRGGQAGEIPLWYGITEDLIPEVWKKVLVVVAGTTSLRAGASVATLESTFKPALEGWEIWRLMEWGVLVGLMRRVDESCEGWTVGEWWWSIVGRYCEER